jgi:hypothetical protein
MLRAAFALTLFVAALSGCRHEGRPPRDLQAEAAASAAQRLQGRWVLVSFQPETPLEPTLQVLLNTQIERFFIDIRGSNISGQGPGITVTRTYQVGEAYGDHFKATVYDAYGVGLLSSCDFNGNQLLVNSINAPWRGKAVFRRVM